MSIARNFSVSVTQICLILFEMQAVSQYSLFLFEIQTSAIFLSTLKAKFELNFTAWGCIIYTSSKHSTETSCLWTCIELITCYGSDYYGNTIVFGFQNDYEFFVLLVSVWCLCWPLLEVWPVQQFVSKQSWLCVLLLNDFTEMSVVAFGVASTLSRNAWTQLEPVKPAVCKFRLCLVIT